MVHCTLCLVSECFWPWNSAKQFDNQTSYERIVLRPSFVWLSKWRHKMTSLLVILKDSWNSCHCPKIEYGGKITQFTMNIHYAKFFLDSNAFTPLYFTQKCFIITKTLPVINHWFSIVSQSGTRVCLDLE